MNRYLFRKKLEVIKSNSREEYLNTQIDRSNIKFSYCKVSLKHVLKWKKIIRNKNILKRGPIICLGTRNGREIDLFRIAFLKRFFNKKIFQLFEIRRHGWKSLISFLEKLFISDIENINEKSVLGVEINPLGKRKDVLIGSFDDLPKEWENKFNLIYSNSFDQSEDPYRTAKEWIRIAKNDAIFIISFSEAQPTESDPVGNLSIKDFIQLFPGEIIYFEKNGSNYNDLILKIKK